MCGLEKEIYSKPVLKELSAREMLGKLRRFALRHSEHDLASCDQNGGFPIDRDIETAILALRERGYEVRPYNRDGRLLYEIDGAMLTTMQELRTLGAEIVRLTEMHGVFAEVSRRRFWPGPHK